VVRGKSGAFARSFEKKSEIGQTLKMSALNRSDDQNRRRFLIMFKKLGLKTLLCDGFDFSPLFHLKPANLENRYHMGY
jgi:hypothetical protein